MGAVSNQLLGGGRHHINNHNNDRTNSCCGGQVPGLLRLLSSSRTPDYEYGALLFVSCGLCLCHSAYPASSAKPVRGDERESERESMGNGRKGMDCKASRRAWHPRGFSPRPVAGFQINSYGRCERQLLCPSSRLSYVAKLSVGVRREDPQVAHRPPVQECHWSATGLPAP